MSIARYGLFPEAAQLDLNLEIKKELNEFKGVSEEARKILMDGTKKIMNGLYQKGFTGDQIALAIRQLFLEDSDLRTEVKTIPSESKEEKDNNDVFSIPAGMAKPELAQLAFASGGGEGAVLLMAVCCCCVLLGYTGQRVASIWNSDESTGSKTLKLGLPILLGIGTGLSLGLAAGDSFKLSDSPSTPDAGNSPWNKGLWVSIPIFLGWMACLLGTAISSRQSRTSAQDSIPFEKADAAVMTAISATNLLELIKSQSSGETDSPTRRFVKSLLNHWVLELRAQDPLARSSLRIQVGTEESALGTAGTTSSSSSSSSSSTPLLGRPA